MDQKKILQLVRRVRSAYTAMGRDLAEIEKELERVPEPPRKRQNLKQQRIEHYERAYASGKFTKPDNLKKKKK